MTDIPLIGTVAVPDLHVMSFNIRRRMTNLNPRPADRWEHRRPLLQRILEIEQPTLLGVQEALPEQAGFVRHALGDRYRSIGYGRERGQRGEGCPLLYDHERLELLDWSQVALSDTPRESGSTGWGNRTPRMFVNAKFRDRATAIEFQVINTHLDQQSRNARVRSAEAIREAVAESRVAAVVTGDFNTDANSAPYETITAGGLLVDSWDVAAERVSESWGTFLNYRAPRHERKRIDWILVTPAVAVLKVGINVTRYEGGWPSDHAPVQAVVRFGG